MSAYDVRPEEIPVWLDKWEEIDGGTQAVLIEWYNQSVTDDEDHARLAMLHEAGEFIHYDCGNCGEEVREAQPKDWEHFQGVNEAPGCGALCAECYALYERLAQLTG